MLQDNHIMLKNGIQIFFQKAEISLDAGGKSISGQSYRPGAGA
jgi:hypothetical protein